MNEHLIIAAGFSALGFVFVGFAIFRTAECFHSRSWPSVEASILSSSVVKEFDDGIYYPAKVTYRYTVNGHTFVGERIKVGGEIKHVWAWVAKRTSRKYPVGAVVRAYYSRQDPSIAVLEPGFNIYLLVGIIAAGIVFLVNAWNHFAIVS